ncbi:hypothetical protein ACFQ71_40090 [Streptomyces sp. NPDC056534]|uniref:terpene synthase family protein n=1 Tax=Streptomyces sp. NPDC056534 TaxID=3345857 RepID=UPI0036B9CF22
MSRVPSWIPGSIKLSELYSPSGLAQVSPVADEVSVEVRSWILPHLEPIGAPERLIRTVDETLLMCAYVYPGATKEALRIVTIFNVLQFLQDDLYDLSDPSAPAISQEIASIHSSPDFLGRAMLELYGSLCADGGGEGYLDSTETAGKMFLGSAFEHCVREIRDYGNRCDPMLFKEWAEVFAKSLTRFASAHCSVDFSNMHVNGIANMLIDRNGMDHTVHLVELANGSFLTAESRSSPPLVSMRTHVNAIGSYLNQIISFEKEVTSERPGNNLLEALMTHEGMTLREAAEHVALLAVNHRDEFDQLAERALARNPEVALYVEGLRLMANACWTWQLKGTTRYTSMSSPFAELLG